MPFGCRTLLPPVAVAACLAPSVAGATGCMREIPVPIRFQQGAVCWRHVGVGTTFSGQFGARQHVTAIATGQTLNADATHTWVTTGPWQLSVTGPNGFFANASDNGQLDTVLPAAGSYSFSIGPCAVWGNQGTVEICTQ
jgi:hypothetical protein